MPKYLSKRFVLEGSVQGVGCRSQVCEWADSIGHISGWVRNLSDGSVEVCAKGPDWRLKDFEEALAGKMTLPVRISRVKVEDLPEDFTVAGFVIKRDST